VSSGSGADAGAAGATAESFFACPTGTFGVVPGARVVAVTADGRVAEGLADEAREVRGARVVAASPAGRVVSDRFAAVAVAVEVVDEEASD